MGRLEGFAGLRRLGRWCQRHRFAVIGTWFAAAVVLNLLVPQLEAVVKRDATPMLPTQGFKGSQIDTVDFGGAVVGGYEFAVLENDHGISQADLAYLGDLAARVRANTDRVAFVQEYLSRPELKSTLLSKDGKAIYMPVGLKHEIGTPEGNSDVPWLRAVVAQGRPSDLRVYVTGESAYVADLENSVDDSVSRTGVVTVALLVVILLLVYRSPVTPAIPLLTIGFALMVVRPLVALLGMHLIKVSSFTETFIIAIVFGAGTDYCIFIISRFREQRASGQDKPEALETTIHRVGHALAGSAGTVIMGTAAMGFANVSLFNTTGPAIGVAVAVTLLAGLSLTPALLATGGEWLFWPKALHRSQSGRFWTRAAQLIESRPRKVLLASLLPLVVLASLYPTIVLTYDERSPQPKSNPDIIGLDAVARHFPTSELLPDIFVLVANHDLRNTADLATIDRATLAVTRVKGVASVRSFTQPN